MTITMPPKKVLKYSFVTKVKVTSSNLSYFLKVTVKNYLMKVTTHKIL